MYGAAISRRQYLRVTLASGIGSVLEWYDYTVLVAMSPSISANFFPPGDVAAKQLSFWSVYAVGFLFRPLGSLLFGHICDVHGRRLSLLITLILMAIPTVLIGALPTYAQVGLAAPILLSLLRLVQGIAVGGELGTAVVFMHELAPAGHKTKGGSIVFLGVTAGIMSGLIVAMVVTAAMPQSALLHWGWRIPFLIAFLTAAVGLMLRYHMPESYEFEEDPVKAAHRQHLQQQASLARRRSCSSSGSQQVDPLPPNKLVPADTQQHDTTGDLARCADAAEGRSGSPTAAPGQKESVEKQQQPVVQQQQQQCSAATALSRLPTRCLVLGHDPIRMLFRDHWREVLLLFWFEWWSAGNFYVAYGWLPSYMQVAWKAKPEFTMGMTLANMSVTLGLIPFAAHLADKGLPRLAATAGVLTVAALASVPMLLAISSQSLVAAWLMQGCDLFLNASIFGWLPSIGSNLFPVHVRATGYNSAHTAAQSWLGGLSPVLISAIALRLQQGGASTGSIYLVTGVYLTVCALVSLVALSVMWRLFPQTNRDAASSTVLPASAAKSGSLAGSIASADAGRS